MPEVTRLATKSAPAAVTVANTATLLKAANQARHAFRLVVPAGGAVVYVGTSAVATTTGIPVTPTATQDGVFEDRDSTDAWYGIVAASTQGVRVLEVAAA